MQWLMLGEWSGCALQSPVLVPVLATMTSSVLVQLFAAMTSSIGPVGNALRVVRLLWFAKFSAGPGIGNNDFKCIGSVVCSDDFQYWYCCSLQ